MYHHIKNISSLNPYSNGRYSRRLSGGKQSDVRAVLILILMEDTLGVAKKFLSVDFSGVLILILMEDTLGVSVLVIMLFASVKVLILILMEDTLGEHLKFKYYEFL